MICREVGVRAALFFPCGSEAKATCYHLQWRLPAEKDDAAEVANNGFDAMIKGEGDVVSGFKNKVQSAAANVTPAAFWPASIARRPSRVLQKNDRYFSLKCALPLIPGN